MPKRGRPIDPTSERARKPWEELGISRATYHWKKRYGDLPMSINIFKIQWPGGLRNALLKLVRKHPHYNFLLLDQRWASGGIRRPQIEWLIKKMGLTRKANRIAAVFVKPTLKPFPEFADEGVAQPSYQPLEDLRAVSLYGAFNEQEKADFDGTVMRVLAQCIFSAIPLHSVGGG